MHKLMPTKLLPLALAGVLLLAGLGAAAIPGAVTGDAPAVVKQAVTVGGVGTQKANTASPVIGTAGNWETAVTGTVSADETTFLAPVTIATGDSFRLNLTVKNSSLIAAAAQLTLSLPGGLSVVDTLNATRVSANTWLAQPAAGTSSGPTSTSVVIVVRSDDTVAPGFYTIGATLKQIEG